MKKSRSLSLARKYLGEIVEVVIDKSIGSKHHKHGFLYESNYGYIAETQAPDGDELGAYFLGTNKPLAKAKGICIAIIHRLKDDDDKLVVVPEKTKLTDKEIAKAVRFQEQWSGYEIIRK